jgi:hypothetical protein
VKQEPDLVRCVHCGAWLAKLDPATLKPLQFRPGVKVTEWRTAGGQGIDWNSVRGFTPVPECGYEDPPSAWPSTERQGVPEDDSRPTRWVARCAKSECHGKTEWRI